MTAYIQLSYTSITLSISLLIMRATITTPSPYIKYLYNATVIFHTIVSCAAISLIVLPADRWMQLYRDISMHGISAFTVSCIGHTYKRICNTQCIQALRDHYRKLTPRSLSQYELPQPIYDIYSHDTDLATILQDLDMSLLSAHTIDNMLTICDDFDSDSDSDPPRTTTR